MYAPRCDFVKASIRRNKSKGTCMRCTVCVGTFPNLGTPTLKSLNSSNSSVGFTGLFRSSASVRDAVFNSDNVGPLGCAGRWRALQLHVPRARARHADADLGNLSTPHLYEPPLLAPAARSSHRCVCKCRCHASHYTELAHRHSRARHC